MIEFLLIILIILAVVNIAIGLKKKISFDIKPQLKEVEESILDFDKTLERTEKSIKDEFQINRKEANETSKINREELAKSLKLFEDRFSENTKNLNELLRQKFGDFNKQQIDFNKQTNDSTKENREELTKSLKSFESKFSENTKDLNERLGQNFSNFNKQQIDFNKQTNDSTKENREELTKSLKSFESKFSENTKDLNDRLGQNFSNFNKQQIDFNKQTNDSTKENREELTKSLKSFESKFSENTKDLNERLRQNFSDFNKQQIDTNKQATDNIRNVEKTIEKQLKSIREDNTTQLNEMRKTVDEKLQTTLEKRLGESFKQVSSRLEEVHKGLGEMQNLATGVGDLKKVLSNVKTRGVLGEYQLENILEQILTPEQYAKNVATKKGSQANVEFAVKLPGQESEKEIWLPIDSKFPIEDYHRLLDAFDKGDKTEIENAQKFLIKRIEHFAKEISEKYIDPPHTTDFGIMFLPVESLYAEVLRHPSLFETLQRKYKITITGPTTLSALLNSLQMGFRTLAVQKRSSEVWDVLKAVKFEFKEFSGVLSKVHKQLNTASGTLETLRTTRTNVMERKLKDVETFTAIESKEILELPDNNIDDQNI